MRQTMSANTKRELLLRFRREYLVAGRRKKSSLLNNLVETTGYNRKYAIQLLNQPLSTNQSQRRKRKSKYGEDVMDAVSQLWRAANGICAKRLKPFLPSLIETLDRFGHLKLAKPLKEKILKISISTLERMLKKEREREGKGKSLTRPGSLLRKQVAVKTFAEWNDQEVGFFEIDLVAHCGGNISGKFIQTLTMTDIATGWTEIVPLLNKSDTHVRAGLEKAMELIPFKLKGIDCDNGKEFLNYEMVAWCKEREITFTRSRAYRKNDQAHVEEKNGSVVRKLVGYDRFEGRHSLEVMLQLYSVTRLYINHFQPCMKLVKKTRTGSKVSKKYDTAKTPLERVLEHKSITAKERTKLKRQSLELDPLTLLAEMSTLQAKLWDATPPAGQKSSPDTDTKYSVITDKAKKKRKRYKKRPEGTATAEVVDRIVEMDYGSPIKADDFLPANSTHKQRHFVNSTLHRLCEQGLLARQAFGKYIRANESARSDSISFGRKLKPVLDDKAADDKRKRKELWQNALEGRLKKPIQKEETEQHPIPERAARKKRRRNYTSNGESKTAQLLEAIAALPFGSPVQASDYYQQGASKPDQHLIHVILMNACDRALLTRVSNGKYVRTDLEGELGLENKKWKGRKGVERAKTEITEAFVDDATLPQFRSQFIYRDSKLKGFGLRVTRASKSFVVEARINGKNRRITIGRAELFSVEDARQEAIKLLRQMTTGIDPLTAKRKRRKENFSRQ